MSDVSVEFSGPAAESWQGYRFLADNAVDVVIEASLETVIRWVSPSVEEVLGWRPADLVGRSAGDVVHPDDIGEIRELAQTLSEQGVRVRSRRVRLICQDGAYKTLQLRGRPAIDATGTVVGHIITMQDTSERDDALRALAVLNEGNRVLARAADEDELLHHMCETIATTGGYAAVWYARPRDDAERTLVQVAGAGFLMTPLQGVGMSWGDGPFGRGPTGTALRTQVTQVRHDLWHDPDFAPWVDIVKEAKLQSAVALPVVANAVADGALVVYATEPRAFDDKAVHLLEALASDLGMGLERLRGVRALAEKTREAEESRARMQESESRYRLLAENSSDVVWQIESDRTVTWVSESVRSVLGWEPEEVNGHSFDLVHPDDRDTVAESTAALDRGLDAAGEARFAKADGSWKWMAYTGHRASAAHGLVDVVALHDIDDAMQARTALIDAVGIDPLTGIAARPAMLDRIGAMLGRLRGQRLAAVVCVGVDRLSEVNDAYAHSAGDLVITTVATRIVETVGKPDLIGRGNSVEFLVVLPDLRSGDEAALLAQRILEAAKGAVSVGTQVIEPTVSIGISIGDRHSDREQLVRDASAAMGRAKAEGRDRYVFADASMADEARRRLDVERSIRDGLEHDRFLAHFQPIVDLPTGRVDGYESLVRYARPDGSIALPARFLPIAELSPLIADIDMLMLRRGLAALTVLPEPLTVAVNISPVTLTRPGYPQLIEQLIRGSEASSPRLHLEITETALLGDTSMIIEAMKSIADIGARWYVDDFGTGYSSISHLRDLPIAGLKLDLSFSAGIRAGEPTSIRLGQALAGLAGGLDLDTVAEGIETPDEATLLQAQGWRHGQGWLYGRPGPLP